MPALTAHVLLNRLQAKARLRHLQVLVKLAELSNLNRSAEALGLSQPAVTQLLADLESLLEVPLFDRHSRGVRITPYGAALLPLARRMLGALAEGSETLIAMKQAGEGAVRIAAITGAISGLLTQVLPAFAQAHPRIQVRTQECSFEQGVLHLAQGDIDLLATRQPPAVPAGCRFIPVQDDRFVVACGPAHPLAGRRHVRWSTLCRENWLLSPVGTLARSRFDAIMADLDVQPQVSPVVTRVQSLTWALLTAQRMLTLVPYSVVRQLVETGQLGLVGTPEPIPFDPLGLIVPQVPSATATSTLVEYICATQARDAEALQFPR